MSVFRGGVGQGCKLESESHRTASGGGGGGGTDEWKDRHFEKGYLFFVFLDAVLETSFLEEEKHSPLASTMHFSLELV